MSRQRTYGWGPVQLFRNCTLAELAERLTALRQDPTNASTVRGLALYTPQAAWQMDQLAWAITYHQREARAAGQP